MAQIFAQIDRATFNTVLVICPSIINQDFQERAEVLCNVFRKEICFLDGEVLGSLLLDYEEQSEIDKIDVGKIYKFSKPSMATKLKITKKQVPKKNQAKKRTRRPTVR